MAVGGQYTVQLRAILDTKGVLAQIAQIQKQAGKIMIGGAGATKGAGGIAAVGKEANRTAAGVRKLNTAIDTTGKNVRKIEGKKLAGAYTSVGKGAKQATSNVKTFGSTTLDVTKKVVQFGAVTAAIRGVTTGMGAMVQQTFELDGALVEFKKVSDLSGKGLEKYTKQAYEAGKATAKTGVEMVDAATQFKKMGYDEQTSMQLAKHATMFQNVADAEISAGDAAKFINSQMKAYQGEFKSLGSEGEKAAKVIDTVNEVANKNAVGTNDLQLALTKTSAAMGGFGNSFDQVVGIMTAGTEIMVGMPSQVARGWRTIGANILQIAQSSDEYVAASGKVKIATRDQNGEMKNTYSMMKDLYTGIDGVSVAWKDLSKEEQSAIALQLGGKNNMEKFRAVMDNFKTAIKATEEAQQSQGSATRENARYLDSLEGRLQAVKSAWSRFSNAMVQSDDVKKALSGLAGVLEFLASDFGQGMIKAGMAVGSFVGAVKLLNAIRGAEAFSSIVTGAGNVARSLGISTKAAGKFTRALGGISSGGLLAIAAVAGTIGYGMYQAWKSTHKYRDEVKELSKANEENVQAIDANADSAQFYADKIEELSRVENKSTAEKERMAAYVKKLNELMPGLNLEYDKEKDALNKTTDAVRKYIEAKREEAKVKAYQENFENSLKEQVKLEEKRKKALEDFQAAQKQYDEASKTGYVDPTIDKNLQKAKKGLHDVTQAYISASKETAKQSNNMVKASGDWEKLADTAKVSGTKISDSLVQGIEDGVYLIPEKLDDLKSLASFDDLAQKLNASSAGKSVVEALQQGMREGDINVNDALKIAQQMQDFNLIMGKEGRQAVEELSNQFARGEIDFSQLQNGIREALGGVKDFDLGYFHNAMKEAGRSTEDVVNRLEQITEAHPDAKITIGGVELAEEQVSTVIDYLNKVDGDDPKATVNINGTDVAVSEIESLEDLARRLDGKEFESTVKTKGGEKAKDEFTSVEDAGKEIDGTTYKTNVKVKGGDKAKDEVEAVVESGDELNGSKYTGKVEMKGGEKAAESAETAKNAGQQINGKTFSGTLQMTGAGEVAEQASTAQTAIASIPTSRQTTLTANTKGAVTNFQQAKAKQDAIKTNKTATITAKKSGEGAWSSLKSIWNSIKSKTVTITGKKVGDFAKGTRNAPEGLAEVNEQGWEFIRDAKTGKLRIAGGGKRTVTLLSKGDAVYTHEESKRMLSDARNIEIPQHKKGKKGKKKKSKTKRQTTYNKKYDAIQSWYENELKKAEHTKEMKHYSDKWLADKQEALRTQAENKLKALNKQKISGKGKLTKKGALSQDIRFEQEEAMEEALHDIATKAVENMLEGSLSTAKDLQDTIEEINKQSSHLSEEEKEKYLKEAYKNNLEYTMKQFQLNKTNYSDMKKLMEDYYKDGKITVKEYYEYLDELMEEQLEKQKKALEKIQQTTENTYSLASSWIDRQIERLEKQNEETDEQNELIEKQNDLEKARAQRVKVYRQGKGFVYEQDTQAIKEATSALKEYKKEQESPELKAWREVKDLFDDLEASAEIANLERLVGGTFEELFGGYGTDLSKWTSFIKENLATKYGYENLLEEMEGLEDWEAIQDFLDATGVVSQEKIEASIARNRFATGTLSAPAGFARVAENGYEIALLGHGDAVMPHGVSENLMAWGAHSPVEYASAVGEGANNQVYNFDSLILPNVTNADSFIRELNDLPNRALQYSRGRA